MDADAVRLKPAIAGRALVDSQRLTDIDAELVLAQPGRDIGMGLGKDVWVHAQGKASLLFKPGGAGAQQFEFRLALDVEFENAQRKRFVDLGSRLARAGEDDAADCLGRGDRK